MDELKKEVRSLYCNSNRAVEVDEIAPILLSLIERIEQIQEKINAALGSE